MKFLVAVPGATGLPEALGPLLCGQTAWIALFNECTVQSSCDFTVLVSVAGLPREVPCMKRQHASFEDLKRPVRAAQTRFSPKPLWRLWHMTCGRSIPTSSMRRRWECDEYPSTPDHNK